jgi:hypothetical protein
MEELFSLLVGVSGKIYDDIEDNNLNINSFYKECFKSLNIVFYTVACKNDFMFSFSTLCLALFGAGIDNNYWKSFAIIALILSILYYSKPDNIPLFILIIILIIISTRVEEKLYTEEFSLGKLISRIIGLIIFGFILFVPSSYYIQKIFGNNYYIESSSNLLYIRKLMLIAVGGLIVSIISQIYFLYFKKV